MKMRAVEKVNESRLRRQAYKLGIRIEKSRIRNANLCNQGGYRLIDVDTNILIDGLWYELTLRDVGNYLKN